MRPYMAPARVTPISHVDQKGKKLRVSSIIPTTFMPDILMLKCKNGHQFTCRRFIAEHRNFGHRKTLVRSRRLSISKIGLGAGTLTSSPTGIDCGATCSATFTPGSVVTLTATPASGNLGSETWGQALNLTFFNVDCEAPWLVAHKAKGWTFTG